MGGGGGFLIIFKNKIKKEKNRGRVVGLSTPNRWLSQLAGLQVAPTLHADHQKKLGHSLTP